MTIATGTVTLLFKPAPFLDALDLLLGTAPQPGRLRHFLNLNPETFLDVFYLLLGTAPSGFTPVAPLQSYQSQLFVIALVLCCY